MSAQNTAFKPVRLSGVQGLRGLAVLMVMVVHIFQLEVKYSKGPHLFDEWIHFCILGVDLFLAISGFVLTYLAFNQFASRGYLKSYTYNRITRVYPVYLLYTAALVPIFLIQPTLFNAAEGHQVNLLRTMLLLPDVHLPLIPVAWTLHHELYFYVVFGLMLLLPQSRLLWCIAAFTLVTAALSGYGYTVPRATQGAFEKVFVNPINFEFIFGMVAAYLIYRGERRWAWAAIVGATLWAFASWGIYLAQTGKWWVGDYARVVVYGIPSALFLYGIVALELQRKMVFAKSLVWIGDAAYSIYLTHIVTLAVAGRLWRTIGIPGLLPHILFLAAAWGLGLLIGKICYDRIEKPMMDYVRRFDPARRVPAARPVPG